MPVDIAGRLYHVAEWNPATGEYLFVGDTAFEGGWFSTDGIAWVDLLDDPIPAEDVRAVRIRLSGGPRGGEWVGQGE